MPEDIEGITINLGFNTAAIDRGMQALNRKIGTLNAQMKSQLSAFDKAEASTNKYQARLETLNKQLEIQGQKVNKAKEKFNGLKATQDKANKSLVNSANKLKKEKETLDSLSSEIDKHTSKVKSTKSAYKTADAASKKYQSELTVLRAEQKAIGSSTDTLKNKLQNLANSNKQNTQAYKETQATLDKLEAKHKELSNSINQANVKYQKQRKIVAETKQAHREMEKSVETETAGLKDSYKKQQKVVNATEQAHKKLQSRIQKLPSDIDKAEKSVYEEEARFNRLDKQLKRTEAEYKSFKQENSATSKVLDRVKTSISNISTQLKRSMNQFKASGESVEAYKERINDLKIAQKRLKNQVNTLAEEYKLIAQEHGKNSEAAQNFADKINLEKIKLKDLNSEISQTEKSYKKLRDQQKITSKLSSNAFGRSVLKMDKYKDSIKSTSDTMKGMGRSASIYMTAPIVAGFSGAIKASIDWEDALAGVAKTTDMTQGELNQMGKEITNMSNKMPFASTEIAGVAEAAGQLGVQKSQITDFTKTMLDLSVATNLTSDEAAEEFARFANAAGMPLSKVDKLGAAVVQLGNTTATTEKEIVDMGQRLAGAGAQAGFSADEIMSISAAMSSAGIDAEAGGTAMTQIMNKITKATAEGGKTLNGFAKTSGMSADEFAKTWKNNPTKALSAFVEGLGKTKGGAKGVQKALEKVGINGIREADTVRRMANNHEVLDKALKNGKKGWEENKALVNEANTRYKTMKSRLITLKNNFVNFGRSVGDALAPLVSLLSSKLSELFKSLQNTSDTTKIIIAVFGGLIATIPPLLTLTGLLAGGILNIAKVLTMIPGLASVFSVLTGPIGIAVAAITALATAFVIAYKKSATFRQIVNQVVESIKNTFLKLLEFLKPAINSVIDFFKEIGATFKTFWQENGSQIITAFQNIYNYIKPIIIVIKNVVVFAMKQIWAVMKWIWPIVKSIIVDTWNDIKNVIRGVIDIILGIVKVFAGLFTGDWKKMWEGIKQILKGAVKIIWYVIKVWFLGKIFKVFKIFGKFTRGLFGKLKGYLVNIWKAIKNKVVTLAESLVNIVIKHFKVLKKGISHIFSTVKNFVYKIWTAIKNKVISLAKYIRQNVIKVFSRLKNSVRKIFNTIKAIVKKIWNAIKNTIVSIAKHIWHDVTHTFTRLKKSLSSILTRIKNFFTSKWKSIKNTVVNLASGLRKKVVATFNRMKNTLKGVINKITGFIDNLVKKVKQGLNKLIKGINWVGDKLGMGKQMIKPLKLSTGTETTHTSNYISNGKVSQGLFATVGDKGPGNGSSGFRNELIRYPNGRMALTPSQDTTTFLPRGSSVINGAQTQDLFSRFQLPRPRFSKGTGKKKNFFESMGDKAGALFSKTEKTASHAMDAIGSKTKDAGHWVKDKATKVGSKALDGAAWLKDKVKDIMDYAEHPGKLLNLVLKAFGVNFTGISGVLGDITRGAFKKLKKGAKNLISSWFEDSEGGGGYNPFKNWHITRGWTPNGHAGIDYGVPEGTKIPSPIDGTVIQSWFSPNQPSGGNETQIYDGHKYTHIFMHQSKRNVKKGQKVHQGQIIGRVGNTGNSFGAHLHWQINKGKGYLNNHPDSINPLTWVKEAAKGVGGSGASNARKAIKKAQSILGGRYKSSYITDQMMRVAKRESNFTADAQNDWDSNAKAGTPSKGMFQMIEPSFKSFAKPGHGNILNPTDEAISAMRYIVGKWVPIMGSWRSAFKRAGDYAYATGGLVQNSGLYQLAEEGHPEWVIPTDPKRRTEAMKLLALAGKSIMQGKQNKRPNHFNFPNTNQEKTSESELIPLLKKQIQVLESNLYATAEQNELLKSILTSSNKIEKQPKGFSERDISYAQGNRARLAAYNLGDS